MPPPLLLLALWSLTPRSLQEINNVDRFSLFFIFLQVQETGKN
jgi:hypothetical protein